MKEEYGPQCASLQSILRLHIVGNDTSSYLEVALKMKNPGQIVARTN